MENHRSSYEVDAELNEKLYKFHFNRIKNVKYVIKETQKEMDLNNDPKIKEICLRTLKKAQKQLTELENRTEEVTKSYERKKKYLKSLR